MLTVKAAAAKAAVSEALVYSWCQQGRLPHYRVGAKGKRGKILIEPADLEALKATCRVEGGVEQKTPPRVTPNSKLKYLKV